MGDTLRYVLPGDRSPHSLTPEESDRLERVNQHICAGDSLHGILDFLFKEMCAVLPCDRISLAFLEDGIDRVTLYHAASEGVRVLDEGFSAPTAGSSLREIFSHGTTRVIDDLSAYAAGHPSSETTRALLSEGLRSSMTVPLFVDGRPVGLLFLDSKSASVYGDRELFIVHETTGRIAQAVEKAWRIEQLRSALNGYMEMLGFVTHELKSPIDSVITIGNTLAGGFYGELGEKQKDAVARMIGQLKKLTGIIGEYLNLARFESGQVGLNGRRFDFEKEVLAPALETHSPLIEGKSITVETDLQGAGAFGDPSLLLVVMNNFVSNAVKYGNERGLVRITAGPADGTFRVTVWNEGPGFPASQKARLFRKFSRIDSEELLKRKGSGIGLYNSWKIITLHGGTVRADSEEGKWASFSFEIPLPPES